MTTETAVRERPILFNLAMVRAVLAGSKTQTRRVIKPQSNGASIRYGEGLAGKCPSGKCPYGAAGDRLWVRETFQRYAGHSETWYRADFTAEEVTQHSWKPSIHMPRQHCRILLEVVGVRVERVQDITTDAAIAEGCAGDEGVVPEEEFMLLWELIYAKHGFGWGANPWVWVVEFARVNPEDHELTRIRRRSDG